MPSEQRERRHHQRLPINYALSYRVEATDNNGHGICRNLSADGVMFSATEKMQPGTRVDINITPEKSVVIPLEANVEVIRVTEKTGSEEFEIAGVIREMN